ncbi:MAG: hypothetical protein N3B13_06850 [Deltaproteobacteria bacterium]|nr:hypothetical protein [Deltaproteobacteria bacterium]
MLKFKLWILIPLIMILTVFCFALIIFYGSYRMVIENSRTELLGTTGRLNEVFDNFRLSNRLKAVIIANQISLIQDEMRKKKILNAKGQIDRLKMHSVIVGKLELNFNPKTEYILAYYDIAEKALISLVEDEILNVIISSELFAKVKENNISCDIFTHRNKIYIVSLAPVFMVNAIAGSVIAVKVIDDSLAYSIKDVTSFDISIFSGDNLIGSTFRQSAPEVLIDIMQSKDSVLLHGRLRGKESPYFPAGIPAMITVFQDFVPGKDIKVGVTSQLGPKFSELKEIQFVVLVILIGVLIIGIIVSFSISRTVYTNVNLIKDGLVPAIKGNLSVQIPENKIPSPFDDLVRMINKLLFVAREKVASPAKTPAIFSDAVPKEDVRRTFTGEIKVQQVTQKPVSQEIKQAPSIKDVRIDSVSNAKSEVATSAPSATVPKPMSGEIFVGNELSSEDVGDLIEDERVEEYNPDATMVASLEQIEALDRAKQSARPGELDEFRKVFDKYVAMRLDNNESVENLNFDNFLDKIRSTKADLMSKGNYRDVKFDVIIKNGKVTLKANPVK